MSDKEQNQAPPTAEPSPADKLADRPQTDADTPGMQQPESTVQAETGLNTE